MFKCVQNVSSEKYNFCVENTNFWMYKCDFRFFKVGRSGIVIVFRVINQDAHFSPHPFIFLIFNRNFLYTTILCGCFPLQKKRKRKKKKKREHDALVHSILIF